MRKPRNLFKVLALVVVFTMVTIISVGQLMPVGAAEVKSNQANTIIKSSSMSDATSISIGSQYSGKLSGEEDEYYKFTIPSSGEVSIISKAQMYYIHYYIYDANGNQVWEKDFFEDDTTGMSSANEKIDLTKGTYYLVLQSHVSGNYQFHLAFQDAGETFTETGNGTNNSMNTANDISFGNTYKGQIAENDEKDFYKFIMPSSGRVKLSTNAKMDRVGYSIYDENGNSLWDDVIYKDDVTGQSSFHTTFDLTKGTYYFIVYKDYAPTGTYSFKTTFEDAGESFEESGNGTNNTIDTANTISLGKQYKGQLAKNDEKDFYKFELNSSKKLTFQMTSSQIEKIYYYIYDQNGKQVWYDDSYSDDASGINKVKKELNLAAGTYYLAFERWTDAMTGVYTFSLNQYTSLTSANVSAGTKSYVYDGKVKKPTVTVSYKSNTLKNGTDYTVTYSNNKNVGTGKIKITGKGKYDGTKTVTFTIVPKETKIVKIQGKKRKIAIKWNAQKTQISGYEIQASKSKSFSSKTVMRVGKNSTSANITGLSKNKKYYVRIRTYKNGSQTRYVSKWSQVKSAKAK